MYIFLWICIAIVALDSVLNAVVCWRQDCRNEERLMQIRQICVTENVQFRVINLKHMAARRVAITRSLEDSGIDLRRVQIDEAYNAQGTGLESLGLWVSNLAVLKSIDSLTQGWTIVSEDDAVIDVHIAFVMMRALREYKNNVINFDGLRGTACVAYRNSFVPTVLAAMTNEKFVNQRIKLRKFNYDVDILYPIMSALPSKTLAQALIVGQGFDMTTIPIHRQWTAVESMYVTRKCKLHYVWQSLACQMGHVQFEEYLRNELEETDEHDILFDRSRWGRL